MGNQFSHFSVAHKHWTWYWLRRRENRNLTFHLPAILILSRSCSFMSGSYSSRLVPNRPAISHINPFHILPSHHLHVAMYMYLYIKKPTCTCNFNHLSISRLPLLSMSAPIPSTVTCTNLATAGSSNECWYITTKFISCCDGTQSYRTHGAVIMFSNNESGCTSTGDQTSQRASLCYR